MAVPYWLETDATLGTVPRAIRRVVVAHLLRGSQRFNGTKESSTDPHSFAQDWVSIQTYEPTDDEAEPDPLHL